MIPGILGWDFGIGVTGHSDRVIGQALPRASDVVHQNGAGPLAEVRSAHGVHVGNGVAELRAHHHVAAQVEL